MSPANRIVRAVIILLLICLAFFQGNAGTVQAEAVCAGHLTVSPGFVFQSQPVGRLTTRTLSLANTGGSALDFRIGADHPAGSILALHFEENEGAYMFADSSGAGNNGYCPGTACPKAAVAGKFGRAVKFDGQDDFIQTSIRSFPTGNADRTMAGWFKLDSYFSNVPDGSEVEESWKSTFLFGYGNFGENDQLYSLEMFGPILYFSNWGHILSGPVLQLHRWYHLAVTNTGNTVTLYVDGKQVARNTLTLNTQIGTPFTLGRGMGNYYGGGRLNGLLDEVRVFNRALSASEVESLFQFFGDVQVPWLKVSPLSGTIAGGANFPVQLTFDSRNLAPGHYKTQLLIWSSSASDALVTVPVELLVWNSIFIPVVGP